MEMPAAAMHRIAETMRTSFFLLICAGLRQKPICKMIRYEKSPQVGLNVQPKS